ncbi:ATP-dependent RNA helicase SUV3 homolog, mitochondrial-like [Contarinia nasturtii]|uniref:ATP-dependent RNA helicase SUV3 homolog, mitochondrial-like n=1 Tax=Contarinia nasturtii TaxID=265458 RepID=UPI0012D394C4|nr:ATP-dependent RNA helicase SUV3 homolog, mitochondrial-like [Contarinia nasturtii]
MWRFSQRIWVQSKLIRRNLFQKNETFVRRFTSKSDHEKQNNELLKASKQSKNCQLVVKNVKDLDLYETVLVVNDFLRNEKNRKFFKNHGLLDEDVDFLNKDFLEYCLQNEPDNRELLLLQNKLYDIIEGVAQPDDMFPFFLNFVKYMLPDSSCVTDMFVTYFSNQISTPEMRELFQKNTDLRNPSAWYPLARSRPRKIIFHAGPTNSGKTYRAMQRFREAKTGVYCGPLRLLALEIFQKSNKMGTPCDLVTGEERRYGNSDRSEANHISVTVEMIPLKRKFDVAIIDEIQLFKHDERGYAWTRALLGLNADEIHVCGEAGTKEILERLCRTTGETLEYHHYDRLTQLTVEDKALDSLEKLEPGDCIVCFDKNDIFTVSRDIEKLGKEVAVIYGSLPPNTKLAQVAKFNDPNNPCKIMVASDAIGMGLNLSIRRIIFYSMRKLSKRRDKKVSITTLTTSQTLQIAGRAGRFGTQWEHGYVTTYRNCDLRKFKNIFVQKPEPIEQAGLAPCVEQIEYFVNHFPNLSLRSAMDFFTKICKFNDDLYFMCCMDDVMTLADIIDNIDLPFTVRYVYCHVPIDARKFSCTIFKAFAEQHSQCKPITWDFVANNCGFPVKYPILSMNDLTNLERIYEVLHMYLWLSNRFEAMYPHADQVRLAQAQLEKMIQKVLDQKN